MGHVFLGGLRESLSDGDNSIKFEGYKISVCHPGMSGPIIFGGGAKYSFIFRVNNGQEMSQIFIYSEIGVGVNSSQRNGLSTHLLICLLG